MDSSTSTPPLPISDLHRLQLTYQTLTPVPSTSGGSDDQDYPCYPDYLPQPPNHQYYSSHARYPYPPHQTYPHQHPYPKSEYACMPINMADIPHAPSQELVGAGGYTDDGSKPGVVEMDQEEVDAIIRNKRKVRDPKACYACHRRKVKCDRQLPCDSCVKRDHPELCSYERPTKKRRIALSSALAHADSAESERSAGSGPNIIVPREQWESLNRELSHLRSQVKDERDGAVSPDAELQSASGIFSQSDEDDREGVHAPSNQMGTMHLGSRSVLAYMVGNRSKSTQDAAMSLLEENILPNLGLDNETTTYPFVDLWSTGSTMQDVNGLVKALPEDILCREFWLTFRDIPGTIYPVVPDSEAFDQTLNFMLQKRAEILRTGGDIDPNRPYGVTLPWLALLFAVLASGSQSTGRPAKERELTSQVYICCSYQALRMSNFLTHPSLEIIEALLIIGNALSYNMNPGVSYILLGMTVRSAFSMGLHVQSQSFSEHENYLRSRIWWALAWQDSHFSISYDRPSASMLCIPDLPYAKHSAPGTRSYVESMTGIIKLTQEILRERSSNPRQVMGWSTIIRYKDEVHRIWNDAASRLRDRHSCISMTDHLERLALQLHCSYMISEICRPALKEDRHPMPTSHPYSSAGKQSPGISPGISRRKSSLSSGSPGSTLGDPQLTNFLRTECIKYLEKAVETYVELRQINKFAARSWIGIQRSISAAFLLGVLPEIKQEPRIIRLLTDLEKGIEESAIEDSGFVSESDFGSPMHAEIRRIYMSTGPTKEFPLWVRSMTKSLGALSKLNAALSGGKAGVVNQHISSPTIASFQPVSPAQAAAMYNTPAVSPGGGNPTTGLPMNMQQQYPVVYSAAGRNPGAAMPMQAGPAMGPYTPDSTGGDPWNYGNMTERAMEYVHPGLWG